MSVAYPNQNNVGPSSDSFSASAAFSFDQHNPTQVFGVMATDPQSQMQTQMPEQMPAHSLSVPMVQVSQVDFTSDYDMGNAARDEDIDIDLDLDPYDEDMNLDDLTTPMATVEDDPMEEAANIPSSSLLFGQPGPSGRYNMEQANDEEMADDALGQIVNEIMTDADHPENTPQFNFQTLEQLQRFQQEHLQHLQQAPLPQIVEQSTEQSQSQVSQPSAQPTAAEPSISNPEVPVGSPANLTATQELTPAVEEPKEATLSAHSGAEPAQLQPPSSEAQNVEERNLEEPAPEAEAVPLAEESTEPATPPSQSPPHIDPLKTPQAPTPKAPKHQTPPSSTDPLRISQAETVALENPTPDVNHRDWYALEGQATSGSPPNPTYPAHQEIPTSPLHGPSGSGSSRPSFQSDPEVRDPHTPHSEHETEREAHSQTPHPIEEGSSPHEIAHQSVQDESQNDNTHEDPLLSHPVVVVYRDTEFSLFPALGEKSNLPETCFLPDRSHVGAPLSKLVAALRDVLGEEFTASEELILNFTALGVEFEEENHQMDNFTLYDLLGLYSKLLVQDAIDEARPLYISLTSRKKYIPKLEMIHNHIVGGGGLASWKDFLASLHTHAPPNTHDDHDSTPHKNGDHRDDDNGTHLDEHTKSLEETDQRTEEHLENDDELELEEFEKGLEGDDEHHHQESNQTDLHPEATAVASIDVPKSPSQTTFEKRNPSFAREASNTDISNVPETQLSQHIEATPNEELRLGLLDQVHENSHIKDDEASFVTAQEKQQDTSVAYSGSRSYGFPDSPSSNEEPEFKNEESIKGITDHTHSYEEPRAGEHQIENPDTYDFHLLASLDDGLLNFDDHTHEEEEGTDNADQPEEDEQSSSTLHEIPEGESNNQAVLQGSNENEAGDYPNWDEWAYEEGDGTENAKSQYDDEKSKGPTHVDAAHDLPAIVDGPTEATADDFELDPNEFAYYPIPFSDVGNDDDDDDDASLLGLDHHETLSTTTSTKRAREDDEEVEDELSENGDVKGSPIPASKKHKPSEP